MVIVVKVEFDLKAIPKSGLAAVFALRVLEVFIRDGLCVYGGAGKDNRRFRTTGGHTEGSKKPLGYYFW